MFGHPNLGTWGGDGSGENSEGSSAVSWLLLARWKNKWGQAARPIKRGPHQRTWVPV